MWINFCALVIKTELDLFLMCYTTKSFLQEFSVQITYPMNLSLIIYKQKKHIGKIGDFFKTGTIHEYSIAALGFTSIPKIIFTMYDLIKAEILNAKYGLTS